MAGGTRMDWVHMETPRERLITALEAAMTREQAIEVVEALEACADEGDRAGSPAPWENLTPNWSSELDRVKAERDAAIACAEEALAGMQRTLDSLRRSEPKEPITEEADHEPAD